MEQERNSFKRNSLGSFRSKSSDMSLQNILQEFQKPIHEDFIYCYVDDSSGYKRRSRGSDLLNKLDSSTPFRFSNRNSNTNNNMNIESAQIKFQIPSVPNMLNTQFGNAEFTHSCSCYTSCQTIQCPCYSFYQLCVEGRCCSTCIEIKNYRRGITKQIKIQPNTEFQGFETQCSCKKTKCLKMYCECFAKGGFCSQKCSCEDCLNKIESEIRNKARSDLHELKEKGCKCKRTKCEKKYCDCYGGGFKCTKYCQCENCNNMDEELTHLRRKKQTVKIAQQVVYVKREPCKQLPIQIEFEQPDFSNI